LFKGRFAGVNELKIDKSFLTEPYSTENKEGLFAEFSKDGQLLHFAFYRNGTVDGAALFLEPGKELGFAQSITTDEYKHHADDDEDFEEWVSNWIEEINLCAIRELEDFRRCSFCDKSQEEVVKLIAGPTSYICEECIVLCCTIMNEEGYELKRNEGWTFVKVDSNEEE
jgi:hypothetical protein